MQNPFSAKCFAKTACAMALLCAPMSLLADPFTQVDLVSNVMGMAPTYDPNLKNPWGVAFGATSPFWVSNQGSGTATLYNGAGAIVPLVVTIPAGTPPVTGPTGQVFNSSSGFPVNGKPSSFIFDTLNGTLDAWNSTTGTAAVQTVATPGAVYTGLAQASIGNSTYLYAADSTGQIRVFDSNWTNVTGTTFAGKFVDPNSAKGFVPFNVQSVGSQLFVTYASLTAFGTGLPGGYIDVFDDNGNFVRRFATNGSLYAPWGIVTAPAGFGSYGGDLLVGNFGNGEILVFDPTTGAYLGTIDGTNGQPLVNDFLWSLETRTGGTAIDPNAVYFTAGIDNQQDGLFGEITAVPEPWTLLETASGLVALAMMRLRRR